MEGDLAQTNVSAVRVFCQNVAKNALHVDALLSELRNKFDVLFLQEPPWRAIRRVPSTTNRQGDEIVGTPKHPDWLTVVRPPTNDKAPRVLAYVHNRLTRLRPNLRRDLIDHGDILILSLFSEGRTINIMNVYSDDQHTAINLLAEHVPILPACVLMTGDFNCHSREWDPSVLHHRMTAISLLNTAARLGLELTLHVNPGPTFLSHNVELRGSVIDLVFIKASESLVQPRRLVEWQGPSDHIPLASKFSLPSELEDFKRVSIAKGSDVETQFVEQLIGGIQGIRLETPTTIAEVDAMAQAVADVFSKAWSDNATEKRITHRSEPWWNDTCLETLLQYRDDVTIFHSLYGLYFPLPRDPITCAAAFTFSFLFCTLVTHSDSFSSFPFMLDSYGLTVTPTLYRV